MSHVVVYCDQDSAQRERVYIQYQNVFDRPKLPLDEERRQKVGEVKKPEKKPKNTSQDHFRLIKALKFVTILK